MKTTVILSVVLATAPFVSVKADTLADWTIETLASTNIIIGSGHTIGATQSGVGADIGSGTASRQPRVGVHGVVNPCRQRLAPFMERQQMGDGRLLSVFG